MVDRVRGVLAAGVLAFGCAGTGPEKADSTSDSKAEACVKTMTWDRIDAGWSLRSRFTALLEPGAYHKYQVTLYRNERYAILGCADQGIVDLDIVVYDADGAVVSRDASRNREPAVEVRAGVDGAHYVVVHSRRAKGGGAATQAAVAVLYR